MNYTYYAFHNNYNCFALDAKTSTWNFGITDYTLLGKKSTPQQQYIYIYIKIVIGLV